MEPSPSTPAQLDYVRGLQRRLRLPDRMLDEHCRGRFRKPLAELSRREMSDLLDEMIGWEALPANLQRAMGQRDLPGFG